MKLQRVENYHAVSAAAAQMIADAIAENPEMKLCLPTGSSCLGTYQMLIELVKTRQIDCSHLRCFNMDEYVPLKKEDPNSYYHFLKQNVYQPLGIKPEQTWRPEAASSDLSAACDAYTKHIDQMGGFDLILLGIGRDGHIAFNMPHPYFWTDTHLENLSDDTIKANARFFPDIKDVPRQAITIGMRQIMQSKVIILVADGSAKKAAISEMFNSNHMNPQCPASILRIHPNAHFILDQAVSDGIIDVE